MESTSFVDDGGGGSGPHASHLHLAIYFAFGFLAAHFLLHRFLYRRIAMWLMRKKAVRGRINKAIEARMVKICASLEKLTFHAITLLWALKIVHNEPWLTDSEKYLMEGWPNQELRLSAKLVYMCVVGYYMYGLAALKLWEARRSEFTALIIHHMVAITFTLYSYFARLFRIGLITLVLHDACDVLLPSAKVLIYSGRKLGASICFGLFAISWLVLRLILFPLLIIKTTSYDMLNYLDLSEAYHRSTYFIINLMLLTLLGLHIYWGILICKMIMRQLKNNGQVGQDVRSDSENED